MAQMYMTPSASTSFSHLGNLATFVGALCTTISHPWVIVLRAFDHMTRVSTLFFSYHTC